MSREEIEGLIVFVGVVMLVIVLATRHVTNQRKKHGKYLTRRRLAKWAVHSVLFVFFGILIYLFNRFFWTSLIIVVVYTSIFLFLSDKFNED